jgi:hypothetical protein
MIKNRANPHQGRTLPVITGLLPVKYKGGNVKNIYILNMLSTVHYHLTSFTESLFIEGFSYKRPQEVICAHNYFLSIYGAGIKN